jgi:hypothetical protein
VHPLVAAILVGAGGLDEFGADAEPEPPDAELREAAEGTGGEGLPIVGADPLGDPVGAEEPLEDLLGGLEQRTLEPVTGQEIAGVGVLDRKRVAVAAVAQLELALEVDRPDHIGASDWRVGTPGMGPDPGAPPVADAAMAHRIR